MVTVVVMGDSLSVMGVVSASISSIRSSPSTTSEGIMNISRQPLFVPAGISNPPGGKSKSSPTEKMSLITIKNTPDIV